MKYWWIGHFSTDSQCLLDNSITLWVVDRQALTGHFFHPYASAVLGPSSPRQSPLPPSPEGSIRISGGSGQSRGAPVPGSGEGKPMEVRRKKKYRCDCRHFALISSIGRGRARHSRVLCASSEIRYNTIGAIAPSSSRRGDQPRSVAEGRPP